MDVIVSSRPDQDHVLFDDSRGAYIKRGPVVDYTPISVHVWDYRRYLISMISEGNQVTSSEDQFKSELAFTTKQIESNFSNFSAWHYRSKLLEPLFRSEDESREGSLKDELTWVRNALWIDPNDQSGWLYHRWLMSHSE